MPNSLWSTDQQVRVVRVLGALHKDGLIDARCRLPLRLAYGPLLTRSTSWRIRMWKVHTASDTVAAALKWLPLEVVGDAQGPYSKPDTKTRWANKYGVHRTTLKRWIRDGKIRAIELSDKRLRILISDLPAGN